MADGQHRSIGSELDQLRRFLIAVDANAARLDVQAGDRRSFRGRELIRSRRNVDELAIGRRLVEGRLHRRRIGDARGPRDPHASRHPGIAAHVDRTPQDVRHLGDGRLPVGAGLNKGNHLAARQSGGVRHLRDLRHNRLLQFQSATGLELDLPAGLQFEARPLAFESRHPVLQIRKGRFQGRNQGILGSVFRFQRLQRLQIPLHR